MDDFLDELGELALGSRLKRLSEKMLSSAAQVYQTFDVDLMPKWFTLMALLDKHQSLTVNEASNHLGLTQPALSQFCKELREKGLLSIAKGEQDSRQRVICLTEEGAKRIEQMKPIWQVVEQAAIEMCIENDNDFYASLLKFEAAFERENLFKRTQRFSSLNVSETPNSAIEIITFSDELAHYFETINKQWINDMFVLEDIDKNVLENSRKCIIDKGGMIWFAKHPKFGIVGTCALLNKGNGAFELTKMGVLSSARGLKVGEILLQYVLNQAKDKEAGLNINRLFLLTSSKCEAAIHLYEKNGFVHSKEIMSEYGYLYKRCNVAMEYSLD